MRALALIVVLGCAGTKPLRPIPMEPCSGCSWADVVRLTDDAIDAYDRGDFDAAAERFIDVNARSMSPRGFFNICLALYRSDEKAPDPTKLDRACQACVAAYGQAMAMEETRPRLERLLGMIDETAKRRSVALTCDRSKAR